MGFRDFFIAAPPRLFWLAVVPLLLAAAVCFRLIFRWLHRARLIADTPTANIRSAAQGYVELEGWARMMDGEPVLAPLSGLPCCWYRYRVEVKSEDDGEWSTLESGVSEAIFHLDDGTGRCIVDPDGADIIPSTRMRWRGQTRRPGFAPENTGFWEGFLATGPYRYTECLVREGDPLYAIGQFVALGGGDAANTHDEVRDLLSRWKLDRPELLKRFDSNRDGDISPLEWEAVRGAAEREVMTRWHEKTETTDLPLLKKPDPGRPYLLSTVPQAGLAARFRRKARWATLFFLLSGAVVAWALALRLGA